MTQHEPNLDATNEVNSNGVKYALAASAPYSRTPSASSSLNVSDELSNPYRTTWKIIILYWLYFIFFFLEMKAGRQNILHGMIISVPWLQSVLILFLNRILLFYERSKFFDFLTLSEVLFPKYLLWLFLSFWIGSMTMYLFLTSFTSSPFFLSDCNSFCVFLYIM